MPTNKPFIFQPFMLITIERFQSKFHYCNDWPEVFSVWFIAALLIGLPFGNSMSKLNGEILILKFLHFKYEIFFYRAVSDNYFIKRISKKTPTSKVVSGSLDTYLILYFLSRLHNVDWLTFSFSATMLDFLYLLSISDKIFFSYSFMSSSNVILLFSIESE